MRLYSKLFGLALAFGITTAAAQSLGPPGGGGSGGGAPSGPAGGKLSGTYPNPGLNAACADLTNAGPACAALVGQIPGTATNDSAGAGAIGQYAFANLDRASAITLTSAIDTNVTSISLTAGDWDVSGECGLLVSVTTVTSGIRCSISITTATGALPDSGALAAFPSIAGNSTDFLQTTPIVRISLASTTTIFTISQVIFTSTAPTIYGNIRARRVR